MLVLGLTFKENCPDLRNTKVVDVIAALRTYGMEPVVVDPWVDPAEAQREYNLTVVPEIPDASDFPAVILAVAHQQFADLPIQDWKNILALDSVLVDLKGLVPRELNALRV